ncbi:HTTM domain-containing protein [soil metagenome]
MTLKSRWISFIESPVDGSSLAVFRIWFAICMLINTWMYTIDVHIDYLQPKLFFSFIPGMAPWPGNGMYIHFAVMAASAAFIGLGYFYRQAAIIFFLATTYLFLLEKAYYQNHFYLVSLLSFLLIILPANRVWSVDNAEKKWPESVPRWSVLLLKFQIAIVYFYGGIAKLNYDWLHGRPQTEYMMQQAHLAVIGPIVSHPLFAQIVTYGGIAVDLSLGFLLFFGPTFWLGTIIAVAFHLLNSRLFPIGIFPWLMIGTIGLFAPYDWPRKVLAKIAPILSRLKISVTSASKAEKTNAAFEKTDEVSKRDAAILIFLHVYVLLQILIPLRRFLYPGETSWTELGHRFSWSMMLRTKLIKSFEVKATNPKTGAKLTVDLTSGMNSKQIYQMMSRPDMILRYAHYVADQQEMKTGVRPIVKIRAIESLNLRPVQDLVDYNVDLASEKDTLMPFTWIIPLRPPAPESGIQTNSR